MKPASDSKQKAISKFLNVPTATKKAVKEFKLPRRLKHLNVVEPLGKATDSVLYTYGIVLQDPLGTKFWVCHANQTCREATSSLDLTKTGTEFGILNVTAASSPATRHLEQKHNVISVKRQMEISKINEFDEECKKLMATSLFQKDKRRCSDLVVSLLIIKRNLPYKFSQYREYRMLAALFGDESKFLI